MRRLWYVAVAAAMLVAACGGAPQPTPNGSPAVTVPESARDNKFELVQLTIPGNQTFAIDFTNYDSVPHNMSIRGATESRTGEIFTGPGERTYVFAGLPAGNYPFLCEVHPEMTGSLIVS